MPRTERKFEKFSTGIMPIGKDIDGKTYSIDLSDSNTPHVLVAGRTGSGKSEFIKVIIESRPKDMELCIIDPKRVELNMYKNSCRPNGYGCEPIDAWFLLSDMIDTMNLRYKHMEEK